MIISGTKASFTYHIIDLISFGKVISNNIYSNKANLH